MKYKYASLHGEFFPGLPARDLDTAELTDDLKALLEVAVDQGLYVKVKAEKEKKNESKEAIPDNAVGPDRADSD